MKSLSIKQSFYYNRIRQPKAWGGGLKNHTPCLIAAVLKKSPEGYFEKGFTLLDQVQYLNELTESGYFHRVNIPFHVFLSPFGDW